MSYFKSENAPKTPVEELTALPRSHQLDLRGPTYKWKEGRGRQGGREAKT